MVIRKLIQMRAVGGMGLVAGFPEKNAAMSAARISWTPCLASVLIWVLVI